MEYKGYSYLTPQGENQCVFECPCCDLPNLTEPQCWEICLICNWEDDVSQEAGGANGTYSLSDARENLESHKHMYSLDHPMTSMDNRNKSLDKCIALLNDFKNEGDPKKLGVIFSKFVDNSEWL